MNRLIHILPKSSFSLVGLVEGCNNVVPLLRLIVHRTGLFAATVGCRGAGLFTNGLFYPTSESRHSSVDSRNPRLSATVSVTHDSNLFPVGEKGSATVSRTRVSAFFSASAQHGPSVNCAFEMARTFLVFQHRYSDFQKLLRKATSPKDFSKANYTDIVCDGRHVISKVEPDERERKGISQFDNHDIIQKCFPVIMRMDDFLFNFGK